jgi:hypothetical protein
MYNMSFFRTEIIILIVVLFFVMSGHLFCSCAQTTPLEAFTTVSKTLMKNGMKEGLMSKGSPSPNSPLATVLGGGGTMGMGGVAPNKRGGAASGPTVAALKEGFVGANTNYGESSMYNEPPVSTTSWFTPNLTYSPGQPVSQGIQNILNRPKQAVPLPDGEMLMFKNTKFSGECCPNTYSNSMGCACMTVDQYNYLIDRGGNNVPYSEY